MIEKVKKNWSHTMRRGVKVGVVLTIIGFIVGIVTAITLMIGGIDGFEILDMIGEIGGRGTDLEQTVSMFMLPLAVVTLAMICIIGFCVPLIVPIMYWIIYGIYRLIKKHHENKQERFYQ